jgi:sugar O-acyltransferase (sialic acid O-acetyltransferase NeuD family)
MKDILIVGAGELGQQFRHMIDVYSGDNVVGWIDDTKTKGEVIFGLKVLGSISELLNIKSKITIAIAIGYKHPQFKIDLINKIHENNLIELYTFVHPTSFIDKTAIIEPGVFIYPNATIDMNVLLKSGVLINNSATISHDSIINMGVFIAPNVTISGNVNIGSGCFIGAGTVIKDSITIGNYNTIGSGSNVFKNILDEGSIYMTKSQLIKLK